MSNIQHTVIHQEGEGREREKKRKREKGGMTLTVQSGGWVLKSPANTRKIPKKYSVRTEGAESNGQNNEPNTAAKMRQATRSHHVHHLLPLRLPKREFEVAQLEVPVADSLLQDDRHQISEAATDELLGGRGAFAE